MRKVQEQVGKTYDWSGKGDLSSEKLQCGIKTVVLEGRGVYKALSKSFLFCRRRHRQCRDASLTMTMTAVVAYPIGGVFRYDETCIFFYKCIY